VATVPRRSPDEDPRISANLKSARGAKNVYLYIYVMIICSSNTNGMMICISYNGEGNYCILLYNIGRQNVPNECIEVSASLHRSKDASLQSLHRGYWNLYDPRNNVSDLSGPRGGVVCPLDTWGSGVKSS
jgi:hypothetical protein